jgi:hypothetical protein
MIAGTKADTVTAIIEKSSQSRNQVTEITQTWLQIWD